MFESPFLEIPKSEHITSNETSFAIWDKFPVTNGHALIIPYRIIPSWWSATDHEQSDLMALIDNVHAIIEEKHAPDGYNIGINLGKSAGQTIDHLHIHLIPRYFGDVIDPRGGVRNVIPEKGNYLKED